MANPWKNATLILSGILLGACAGAYTARAVAYGPNPGAPRWEQMCEAPEARVGGNTVSEISGLLAARGAEGWEFTAVDGSMCCFKRPTPAGGAPAASR